MVASAEIKDNRQLVFFYHTNIAEVVAEDGGQTGRS